MFLLERGVGDEFRHLIRTQGLPRCRVRLVIQNAEKRLGLRSAEPVVNDHVVDVGARWQRVRLNQRIEGSTSNTLGELRFVVSVGS